MTKLNSLAQDRVIGPEDGAEDGATSAEVGEGAAGVNVLVVSSSTIHALSSQQEMVMSRTATHGRSSEDVGDDGDDEESSSDEVVESMVTMYVKKIFKYVKKVNMYGYNVHLGEGHHHQHIKFIEIEHLPKKKVVNERRPKQ
jgi:hypothetical protein